MQATPEDAFLYISPIGYKKSSSCGYCRRKGTGHTYFARATSMSPASYQTLIDRCWRRSGLLLYRPNQRDACCPHYTIRLDSARFRTTRDQRQAVNRFNKYVIGDVYAKEAARLYPKSREQARKRDSEFDLVERIHECEDVLLKRPPEPSHVFTVTLEPDDYTEEKYLVFENYQQIVHQEPPSSISRDGFKRFLCSSPLRREKFTAPDGRERQLDCVSAVYFLYHESFHKFSPGKIGALREIALAMEEGYRWWYPGFYIHTCPKMRYKIDFSPQQVLNPDTLEWVDLTQGILKKFDGHGYLDFEKTEEESSGKNENTASIGGSAAMEIDGHESEVSSEDDSESDEDISLFNSTMPGIPSVEEMNSVDLDRIAVRLTRGYCYAGDLFEWHSESIEKQGSAKAMVAELVAAIGPEFIHSLCLDFKRS